MKKGFTLIELLVVTAIIVLFTVLIIPNYRAGEEQLALQRSAYKLSQDVRRVQEMAISAREYQGEVPAGYGIYFLESEPNHYLLFADIDGDKQYSAGDKIVEDLALEKAASIGGLSASPSLTIVFTPPDPEVTITPDAPLATISLGQKELSQKVFIVNVNKAGLIEVD